MEKKDLFNDAFKKEVQKQEQEEQYDFRAFVFPTDFVFSQYFEEKVIRKSVDFGLAIINSENLGFDKFFEDVNFEQTVFNKGGNFGNVAFNKKANFYKAIFEGKAIFSYASFTREANFSNANFKEAANFSHALFHEVILDETKFKAAFFESTRFKNGASFKYSTFKGDANFRYAEFGGKGDFSSASFKEDVIFSSTKFEEVNFTFSCFDKKVSFSLAQFYCASFFGAKFKNATFLGATFKSITDFTNAQFEEDVNLFETKFEKYVQFYKVQFKGNVSFSNTIFKEAANFNYANFEGKSEMLEDCELIYYSFKDTYFSDLTNFLEKIDEDISKGKLNKLNYYYPYPKILNLLLWPIILFRKILKKPPIYELTEFVTVGINPILGDKTAQRYPIIARAIKDDNYLLNIQSKYPKRFFCWWFLSDCGRSLSRWAFWGIVFIVFFAVIYSPAPNFLGQGWIDLCNKIGPELEQNLSSIQGQSLGFWSMLYLSVITFTSFGFDNIVAVNGTARILICVEIILGYVMLGGLISIFSNKLSRRS